MAKPDQKPPAPPTAPTPEPPTAPPAPPTAPTVREGDCAGVTDKLRAYVDTQHGPEYRIVAVGKTQAIICADPSRAGIKITLPES